MFYVHVKPGYKDHKVTRLAKFQDRLDSRIKLSPEEYDQWMAHRETMFGKKDYKPQVSHSTFSHLL